MSMAYMHGNLAERLDSEVDVRQRPRYQAAPRLDVINGRGRDAKAGVAPVVLTAISSAKVIGVALVACCLVALSLMGITRLVQEQDRSVTSAISSEQSSARQLEVQLAVNEDSSRIIGLSTQLYGMVPADSSTIIEVPTDDAVTTAATTQAEEPAE